jgi:glycosyltransferase involved in cell wall biosynthesis
MSVPSVQHSVDSSNRTFECEVPDRLRWAIVNAEYDRNGGVSDYTEQVATGLAAAGDEVTVCGSLGDREQSGGANYGLARVRRQFGVLSLRDLDRVLTSTRPHRVLIQYVPQGYGWHGMNLPFCLWLFARRHRYRISVMFHEVAVVMDRKRPFRHNVQAIVTQVMAALAARAATQIFVSIPAWEQWLRSMRCSRPITWLPIPSNIAVVGSLRDCSRIRLTYVFEGGLLIGVFGTYGPMLVEPLMEVLPLIMKAAPEGSVLLMGENSETFRQEFAARYPDLAGRVWAAGRLSAADLSCHLGACDLMVQLYPDGISTRRTSVMACLSHALPVVTTIGHLTEPLWKESRAVLLSPVDNPEHLAGQAKWLLNDAAERARLGAAGKALYEDRFALPHTIAALRLTTENRSRV